MRQTEADYAFTSRVHVLFQRVLRKFKGDLALWLQYVEFCQRVVSWLGGMVGQSVRSTLLWSDGV